MKLVKVGAAALNQTPLDWEGNTANIRQAIMEAKQRQINVLCLPELAITGYGCEDAFFSPAVQEQALQILFDLAQETQEIVVTIGLPVFYAGALFNASALLANGQIVGFATKQRLAGDGLHYEPRWFKPWPADTVAEIALDGQRYPIGDLLFDLDGVRIGFEICEDAWVAERPASGHAKLAADIVLNPSASHFAFGKAQIRDRLVAEASRAFCVTYVYSNLLGNEAGRIVYDGHTLIGTQGEIVARGPRLNFAQVSMCHAVVDLDTTRMRRVQSASYEPQLDAQEGRIVEVEGSLRAVAQEANGCSTAVWEHSKYLKEEEFTRAITLALYDYLRKSKASGFVVSLSGGADSSAVASLAALMVKLGCHEWDVAEFANWTILQDVAPCTEKKLIAQLLTTVYQATRNSSDKTKRAAYTLAEALGATHYEIDVDDIRDSYSKKIEQALGRDLSWGTDDLTLQNIQARVRGPAAWMLANVKNALLLATSNRSEAAVGYATMDGDTCGGISPIAGIDKAFLRSWLLWLEKVGPEGSGPIPALSVVNELQPTAELRPLSAGQTDEDDLMPYEILDFIEDQAIGEKRSPQEVLSIVSVEFNQYSHEQLAVWVRRFFQLWSRNQWKRERYAPSFHVDDKNLDPKTWCRFPILSGGFQRELANLKLPE